MKKHILTMIINNKQVLCKFKYEHDGNIFAEHIGLKPKLYCCANDYRQGLQKKGKGISRTIVKQELTVRYYVATLTDNQHKRHLSNTICSTNHQVFSITQNKVGLTNYDNKRFYIDNITSVPYGHYKIAT